MALERKQWLALAAGALLVVGVTWFVPGRNEALPIVPGGPPPRATAPTRPAPPRTPAPPPLSAPAADPVEARIEEVLANAPVAPGFYAPALGLELDAAGKVDVSLDGALTLFEVDLADGPIPLRRAHSGGKEPGLFGRGWRSELDSRVVPLESGALVTRIQGTTPFVPLTDDVLISLTGEVEYLRRVPGVCWELVAAEGRTLRFDADGRLAAIEPGFTVSRTPRRVELARGQARLALELDRSGRVIRAGQHRWLHDPATGALLEAGPRRYREDAQGRIERVVAGEQLLLALERDPDGRPREARRGDGWTQRWAFAPGRAETTTPQGRFAYRQAEGGLLLIDGPRGQDLAWVDPRERLIAFQRAGETTTPLDRDELQLPLLRPTRPSPEAVARSLGLTVRKDEQGRPVEVTTSGGRRWTFAWEARRIVGTDGPAGPVELEHDAAGRVIRRADASGRETTFQRDTHGRPVALSTASGERIAWTRDAEARLVSIESGAERLAFQHGPDGLITVTANSAMGEPIPLAYEDGADDEGAWEQLDTPWGPFAADFTRDGRTLELDTPAGRFRFEHDPAGRRVSTTHPSGLVVELERDDAGRITRQVARQGDRVLLRLEHERDAQGRRFRTTRDGEATDFTHDARGRLVGLVRGDHQAAWSWDADGNRTGEGGATIAFDERGRIVERVAADGQRERFTHDAAGRLIERRRSGPDGDEPGADRFDYDGLGRLVLAQRAGGPTVTWGYDPLGRLAWRAKDGAVTRFVHDGERLLAELGPDGRERVWVWGPDLDEPLAWGERADADADFSWTSLVTSDLHTSLLHLDGAGQVVARDALDPWGAGAVAGDRPIVFAGRPVDPDTGLVFCRARWYDPSLGRFLTPDPAGLAAGPNAYGWVEGDPLDRVDPLGLSGEEPGLLSRFGGWIADTAASTRDTLVGAAEGVGYLAGFHGDQASQDAAWAASVADFREGRAGSRALGAVDGYVSGLSAGFIDPNLSGWAADPEYAKRGRAYGEGGAAIANVAAVGVAAPHLARGVVHLAKNAPAAVRALPGAVKAVPGAVKAAPAAVGRGAVLAWRNKGAIAKATARFVGREALGAANSAANVLVKPLWNVLVRPWARLVGKSASGIRNAFRAARPVTPAARTANAARGAAGLADDAARAGRSLADEALSGADDLASAAADDAARSLDELASSPPQDGVVQALGGGPPAAGPRPGLGAPQSPRAGSPTTRGVSTGSGATKKPAPGKGKRHKNRTLPLQGKPNSVEFNKPGTSGRKFGPDGWVQKEINQGHAANKAPNELEKGLHIHDWIPNPKGPQYPPTRGKARPLTEQDLKDFGLDLGLSDG